MITLARQEQQTAQDLLQLNGTDYVEFYVGNAKQASYFYRAGLGFRLVAYAGPETGQPDRTSYVLEQGNIRFVLTAPLRPDNEIAQHIRLHGDGVRDVALAVDDARSAWKETIRRGARSVSEPYESKDAFGVVRKASIAIYGDTVHTFVERRNYHGAFLPGYVEIPQDDVARPIGLTHLDHIAGDVGGDERNRWVDFYSDAMGFSLCQHFGDDEMSTQYAAAMVKKAARGGRRLKFPLLQPVEGPRDPQIDEYLEYHHGPGVQHIALGTEDIVDTMARLQSQGVECSHLPHSYYTQLQTRTQFMNTPIAHALVDLVQLEKLGIQVDQDEEGYLLQAFTRPLGDRPTLFFEIIQRV